MLTAQLPAELSVSLKLNDFTLLPDMRAHEIFYYSRNWVKIRVEKYFDLEAFTFSINQISQNEAKIRSCELILICAPLFLRSKSEIGR